MIKIIKYSLIVFLMIFIMPLVSCGNGYNGTFFKSNILKVDLIYQEEAIIQDINNVRLDLFQLEISYKNGDVERKIVKKSMISQNDIKKLKNVGLHNITVSYYKFDLDIDLLIYDDDYIKENNIYILYNLEKLELKQTIDEYIPEKEGWYFAGWYIDEECNEVYVKENNSNEVQKLYASWSRKPMYTVKFMLDENTCLKEEKVIEGGNATPPTITTNDQQIFIGWDKSFENVRENLIIYAKFQTPIFEVYFVGLNNEILGHYVVEKGANVAPPNAPTIDGYSFVGWSLDTDCVTANLVVKAIYKNIMSVYYYDSDLTTLLYVLDVNEQPQNPVKEGLKFDKWIEVETTQPNTKCFYASYKELESTLILCLQDSYVTNDNVVKSTIELYINEEFVKFIDIKGTEHTLSDDNNYFYNLSVISRITGIYGTYEWFTDSLFNYKVDLEAYMKEIQSSNTKMLNDYILYGKKVEEYPIDNNMWSYTLDVETNTYRVNYIGVNSNDNNSQLYEVFVPNVYNGKKVTIIDTLEVPTDSVVYIGENIEKINLLNTNICNGFIVSEKNKYYESYCGILLNINKASIAKMCNDTGNDYGILSLYKYKIDDIFNNQEDIKSELKTTYDSIDSYSFTNYFKLNPSRRFGNTIVFQENIKIYKNAFYDNSYGVNICFSGDFILMEENDGTDYFGFGKHGQIKINYVNLYEYDFDKIIEITNKIVDNTAKSFTLYLHNINPLFRPHNENDTEYLVLQKISEYYENNYNMTTNIVYDKTSIITLTK